MTALGCFRRICSKVGSRSSRVAALKAVGRLSTRMVQYA
jgi:hypothetical protein